jgi:PadR family transcriptional regulator, regulatory protein PadR
LDENIDLAEKLGYAYIHRNPMHLTPMLIGGARLQVDKELLKGSTVILVLTLLQNRAMYGYEMIKELDDRSGGVFSLKEGTLYPILHALEDSGMVESSWQNGQGDRKRKYYSISDAGRRHLAKKTKEWALFRTAVDRVIGEVGV